MNDRASSTASVGHVGLVAKFGSNGPRSMEGLHQAAAVILSLVQDDQDIAWACSCAEQCLRAKCIFADQVQEALGLGSAACRDSSVQLLRLLMARLGEPRAEGTGCLFGKSLCTVRRVGGHRPWALIRKSRANFWTCLSCSEQGLSCTHREAARLVVSEAADEKAASWDSDNEEEMVEKMNRL